MRTNGGTSECLHLITSGLFNKGEEERRSEETREESVGLNRDYPNTVIITYLHNTTTL